MAMTHDFERDPALKALFSTLDQGVAVFDANRKLLFVNDAMRHITGGHNGVGWSLNDLIERHQLRDEKGSVILREDFPIAQVFNGIETEDKVFEYVAPDGTHTWLSVTCKRIEQDGKLEYAVATVRNITRKKAREDRLRFMVESAKMLSLTDDFRERLTKKAQLAVPSLADWCAIDVINESGKVERVVVVHRDQTMIDYVFEFERRYPPDPNAPGSVYQVIKSGKAQFVPVITDEILRESALDEEQYQAIRKLSLKSVMVIPIDSRGKGLGAMTLAYAESGRVYSEEDLTFFQEFCHHVGVHLDNARLYEEIKKRDEAKDDFLASLSHELRNPLAPIRSSIEMLRFKEIPPEIRDEIDVIEHQFDHMARLLNDLLDVTRFTSGKIVINTARHELTSLVDRALKSAESLVRAADITLSTHFPGKPIYAEVDQTRIEQAVINLVTNAAKFTPAGGSIKVDVQAEDDRAKIIVSDSGAGIAKEDLTKIFEMYYQGKHGVGTNTGLGIGLPLVRRIVELHHGSVYAQSDGPGRGSTFTIELPLAADQSKNTSASPATPAAKGLSVLIVDDNSPAADALARLLNKIDMRAQARYSAKETLESDLSHFDVILLDIGMPEMDGYQLVREIRSRGVTLPVVALTGYGLASDVQKAKDAGFTAHLTKPVGLTDIQGLFAQLS